MSAFTFGSTQRNSRGSTPGNRADDSIKVAVIGLTKSLRQDAVGKFLKGQRAGPRPSNSNESASSSGTITLAGANKGKRIFYKEFGTLAAATDFDCVLGVYDSADVASMTCLRDELENITLPVFIADNGNNGVISMHDGLRFAGLLNAMRFFSSINVTEINNTIAAHICNGQCFFLPYFHTDYVDFPDADEFSEFARVFSCALRRSQQTMPHTKLMEILNSMWKDAPAELKIQIKRNLKPSSLYVERKISVPFRPELDQH